jgi:hypothetical protein
LASGLEASLI